MKLKFTHLLIVSAALFFSQNLSAQAVGDYRTANSGFWDAGTVWQVWNGATWNGTATPPPATTGQITILNGHNITLDISTTVNNLEVQNGGTFTVSNGGTGDILTVNSVAGNELLIDAGGTLLFGGFDQILPGTGSPQLQMNGAMAMTSGTLGIQTTIAAGTTFNVLNDFDKTISANFQNNGTINWSTGPTNGGIFINGGSTFTNGPTGIINENFTSPHGFGGGATNFMINNGIINKNSGQEFRISNTFTNNGTIQGNTSGNIADINVAGVGGVVLSNTGIVAAGNGSTSSGILTIDPVIFTGQAPTLQIAINTTGAVAGTNYDQVIASGSVDLTNTNFNLIDNGTLDPIGTVFTIFTTSSGTITGPFASFNASQNFSGPDFSNPTAITVTKTGILPLTWGPFTAQALSNNNVALNWTTLSEQNTARFVILYSTDGVKFDPIGTVAAAGNSNVSINYSFVHKSPSLDGNNFYRLQEFDLDGKSAYSTIQIVSFAKGQALKVMATPNPMHDLLYLNAQEEGLSALIVDPAGRVLKTIILQRGTQTINVNNIAPGSYELIITQKGQHISAQHLVKF